MGITSACTPECDNSFRNLSNGAADTAGDEGDAFAIKLLGEDASGNARLSADDHAVLNIDGVDVNVEEASVTFKAAFVGTPSAWSLQASSITLTSQVSTADANIKFISADPSAAYFSGNNVAGNLTYTDPSGVVHTISGVISRQFKTGGTTNAFYFYAVGADGLVDGVGDTAYLLQVSNDNTSYVFNGTANAMYRTSSDPVDTALNTVKDASVATLTAATSYSTGAKTALELGTSAGRNGSGNVLDASLVAGFGTGLNVISAGASDPSTQSKVNTSTTSSNGTSVTGVYGTLTIGSDGTYSYAVANSNTSIQALRQASDTLTDTFTYTVKDSSGKIASSTLTVTIEGQNDAPVANADYNTAKIGGSAVTGNALANDTDVDKKGETLSVVGLTATSTVSNYVAGATSMTFLAASTLNNVNNTYYAYIQVGGTWNILTNGNTNILVSTCTQIGTTGNYSVVLATDPTNYSISNGAVIGFDKSATSTGPNKTSTVSTATSTAQITLANGSGIQVGMTVSDQTHSTYIPTGTTVSSVTPGSGSSVVVTLSQSPTTSPNGDTLSFSAAGGATITGSYGTLVLNADGKGGYTYTPNATGTGGTDVFTYQVKDLAGATSTSTLSIQVLAAATTLTTTADSNTISANGTSVTGDVVTNDSSTGGTESVITGTTAGTALGGTQTITSGSYNDIAGQYGTLRLNSNGGYTYTLNTDASTVAVLKALRSGATLTDSFQYLATNATSGAKSAAPLTITINGVNDAPTLMLNPNGSSTNFATGFTPTYTVNGTTITATPAPLATLSGAHVTDVDNTYFAKLTVTFTQSNFSDGSSEQLLINGATGSNTSISNLAGLTNSSTGNFTLGAVTYTYTTAINNGVATLIFTPNSIITQSQAEALLTALRYNNSSFNPLHDTHLSPCAAVNFLS